MTKKIKRYTELAALKGKIREEGTSYRQLAQNVGMAVNTLSDKINGYYCFDANEIHDICHALKLNEPNEIITIFFPNMLRNSTNSDLKEVS